MIITPLGCRIFVRYVRKPIWMPTAPSKLFRIPEHTFYSSDEMSQIKTLHNVYSAQLKSIHEFMRHEFYVPATQSGGLPAEFIEKEIELDKVLYEENDRENAKIGIEREEYFATQIKCLEEKLMEEKMIVEDRLIEIADEVNSYVSTLKSDADSFVTPENIDAMIEKAISNPVSFDFCLDASGKIYGSKPPEVEHFPNLK